MRVVLDSNVIIAAYATEGLCHSEFELCLTAHTLVMSEDILDEVRDKLATKIKVPSKIVKEIEIFLRKTAVFEQPRAVSPERCRDANNLKILVLAHSGAC